MAETTPPSGPVFKLLYVSSARRHLDEPEIEAILKPARTRNAARGITGMLVYGGGNFIQLLEGPREAVEGLFGRIEQDPRHRQVIRIAGFEDGEREFADWSMGYARARDRAELDGAVNLIRDMSAGGRLTRDSMIGNILRSFAEKNL